MQPRRTKPHKRIVVSIAALFIAMAVLMAVALLLFSRLHFEVSMSEAAGALRGQSLRALELSMTNKLSEYTTLLYSLVTDEDMREALFDINRDPVTARALNNAKIASALRAYAMRNGDVMSITLVTLAGERRMYDRGQMVIETELWGTAYGHAHLAGMLDQLRESRRAQFFTEPGPHRGQRVFHVAIAVWDYFSKELMGEVLISCNARSLWQIIGASEAVSGSYSLLALPDGSVLSHPDYEKTGERLDARAAALSGVASDGSVSFPERCSVDVRILPSSGVRLVSVLDGGFYDPWIGSYVRGTALIVLLTALVFLLLHTLVLGNLSRSIRQVLDGIARVEAGDIDARVQVTRDDEIRGIGEAMNRMLARLKATGEESKNQAKRAIQESELRRVAEIQALESQINSHFLYNTLNVINYSVIEGDPKRASTLIKQLASSLRYTFQKSGDAVPLRDEMVWLSQHIALQQARQPSLFHYRIDAAPDTLDVPIHKLLLQPFVENAILHGFLSHPGTNLLLIRARRLKDGRLAISIHDNGRGIGEGQLLEIKRLVASERVSDERGIGLSNTLFRIRCYYGGSAKILLRSRPGHGTKIDIIIPA